MLVNNKRTKLAVKNIGLSLLLKGGSILITFLLVPMTLGYLNSYEYGIWLTLNSIISWIFLLDIGLGNGLRNKLTEALANNDYHLGKIYISTAFAYMAVIVSLFYIVFLFLQHFIDWYTILNVNKQLVNNLNSLVTIVFGIVCVGFIFKMVGNVFMAFQYPAGNDLLILIGNILSLIIIYIITQISNGSLLYIAITFTGVPTLVYLISIPITFKIFPKVKPSIKLIKRKYFSELITLGAKFLFIQVASVVIYMTSNILISHLFGPEEVTPYNIAYKYFSIVITGFTIILSPFWSAITDAKIKNDYIWIKNIFKRLFKTWIILLITVIIMTTVAPVFYKFWISDRVHIDSSFTLVCGIYVNLYTLCNFLSFVINGFGKLKVATYATIIQAIIYIPIAILLSHHMGVIGILVALCLITFTSLLWAPYQCYLLINKKAIGWWDK